MEGLAAAGQLANRAVQSGSFIESICLSASLIDASLRIGLVLKHQIDTRSIDIPAELLYQADDDKIVTERRIFGRAHAEGIIDQDLFKRLETLHTDRNRVVHRYIISEITTSEVLAIAHEYLNTVHEVNSRIDVLERRQLEFGIGMTRSKGPPGVDLRDQIRDLQKKKHDHTDLDANLRR